MGPWRSLFFFLLSCKAVHSLIADPDLIDVVEQSFLRKRLEHIGEPSPLINETRLSKDIIPVHYNLGIKVYLPGYGAEIDAEQNLTFRGIVSIIFKNKGPIKEIVLNQKNLEFPKFGERFMTLFEQNGRKRKFEKNMHFADEYLEKFHVRLEPPLEPGQHMLAIVYKGKMDTTSYNPEGMYTSEYKSADGKTLIAAATQMEPLGARKMVPCFDEPEFKATWNVTIFHPIGTEAVSNQIETGTKIRDNWKETSFATTPPMSSYLLAIGVFNFTRYEGYTKRGMRVRVYASPQQKNGSIALEMGIQTIEGFENYLGIPIPLPKMDMVAVERFLGGMENWGLIYYSPSLLGGDASAAGIIAHEVAHQWFGNLVTMKWWDELYLNEGFASLMAAKGFEFIQGGKYATPMEASPLSRDSQRDSHPVVQILQNNSHIDGMFGGITYQKGSMVLFMASKVMGTDKFEQAVRTYLNKYSYQNVDQDQFLAELDQVITEDQIGPDGKVLKMSEFVPQWTMQMGYPVVTLRESNSTHCELTQRRFVVGNGKEDPRYVNNPYGYKWDIPVWIKRGEEETREFYWLPANGQLHVPCEKNETLVLNPDRYAYFKVND